METKRINWLSLLAFFVPLLAFSEVASGSSPLAIPDGKRASAPVTEQPIVEVDFAEAHQFLSSRRDSDWFEHQKKAAADILAGAGPWDIVIPPFSVSKHAFDRSGRTLMARMLAAQIEQRSGLKVADPGLVAVALGSNHRIYDAGEVTVLAQKLGASTVVTGHVGHNSAGEFDIRLDKITLQPEISGLPVFALEGLKFDDISLPHAVFRSHLDAAVSSLFPSGLDEPVAKQKVSKLIAAVPTDMSALKQMAMESPVHEALYLSFLAELTPDSQSLIHNHLYERALIALDQVNNQSKYVRLLRSRALDALGRRPAAVALLGEPKDAAERALLAWMNGDLPALRKEVQEIEPPMIRLLAEFDLEATRLAYGYKENEALALQLAESHGAWGMPIYRRMINGNLWGQYSNVWTKLWLEELLPDGGVRLEAVVKAAEIEQRELSEFDIAKLTFEHIDRIMAGEGADWLADRLSSTFPTKLDLAYIATETTEENLLKDILVTNEVKGKPDTAIKVARHYESLLRGNPEWLLYHSAALTNISRQKKGTEEGEIYQREGREMAVRAFELLGGASSSVKIISNMPSYFFPETAGWSGEQQAAAFYRSDFPRHSFDLVGGYPAQAAQEANRCLEYEQHGSGCANFYFDHVLQRENFATDDSFANAARAFQRMLDDRFAGSHGYYKMRADALAITEGDEGRRKAYQDAIDEGAMDWTVYQTVGTWLANEGKTSEAADVFTSFPGFLEPDEFDSITLGNNAYDAGSKLFWAGEHESASALYSIAAQDESGSGASISSAIRLLLLYGEFEDATQLTAARARRYENKWAYRDLISMLNALGEIDSAWAIFENASSKMREPELWIGALTGHRRSGTDLSEIRDWLNRSGRSRMRAYGDNLAVRYMFLAGTLDRTPTKELADFISQIDTGDVAAKVDYWVKVGEDSVGPDIVVPNEDRPPQGAAQHRSRLELAADALTAMHSSDFESARLKFEELARWYWLNELSPYLAWASVKSGDTKLIDRWFSNQTRRIDLYGTEDCEHCRYYPQLVSAVLSGSRGDHEKALEMLRRALADRPYTEHRSVDTYYQVLEVAEILYKDSQQESYREFVVDKARRFTRIQPMYSWAYAMVATHTTDPQERTDNLATALHLDPGSWRASQLDSDKVAQAKRWLEDNGPMYLRSEQGLANLSM